MYEQEDILNSVSPLTLHSNPDDSVSRTVGGGYYKESGQDLFLGPKRRYARKIGEIFDDFAPPPLPTLCAAIRVTVPMCFSVQMTFVTVGYRCQTMLRWGLVHALICSVVL